jgi:ubiquinol-cytochrome c reductase cytochrome b subunit
VGRLLGWIDQQTGWVSSWRGFLSQRVPQRAGIGHVLGALALLLFLVCAASGIFLLFYYAPTPDHAQDSIRYIDQELAFGGFVRGLHHWSANALALIIGIHMLRVFLWGAYKRPRQMIWVLGVLLLLITMGESITGYLLPWSENGYWATVVRTQIVGGIPLVGEFLRRLLLNGTTLGALALSRFFALHALFLPIGFLIVGLFHTFQVRVKGVTPPFERVDSEDKGPTRPFHPYMTVRLALVAAVALVVCGLLAWSLGAPVEPRANPNIPYQAHTSWNWMYLYEWARFFPGKWEFIGVVVIPALGVLALLALPYLDRNPERRLRKRPIALTAAMATFLAVTALGIAGELVTPREARLTPLELRGQRVFLDERCNACHGINGGGGTGGPDLAAKTTKTPAQMELFLKDPQSLNPRSIMPAANLSKEKTQALVAYMMSMGPNSRMPIEPLVGPPKPASHFDEDWMVAHKYEVRKDPKVCEECHDPHFCQTCHQNRLPDSHVSREWLKAHSGAAIEAGEYCKVCHTQAFCDACHKGVLHGPDWLAHHRVVARAHSQICANCHTKTLCIECHKGAEPPSHSPGWLTRHGPASRVAGAGCSTCHPASQCDQCHKTRRPPSHSDPAWPKKHGAKAAMGFQDCTLCHGKNSCAVCHRGIQMPHAPDWETSHGSQGATFDKKGPCFVCHKESMCEECHGPLEQLRKK